MRNCWGAVLVALLVALLLLGGNGGAVHAQDGGLFGSFRADPTAPFEISAETLEVSENEQVAIFRGTVQAIQGSMQLTADEIRVVYGTADESADRRIASVAAAGSVIFTKDTNRVSGAEARYDAVQETLTVTGGVVLERDGTRITGDTFIADLASGRSELKGGTDGRVQATFAPPETPAAE